MIEAPAGVGGRFSALTAVGLYPTAFAGIDTRALLRGAAQARDRSLSTDILDNPAAVLAALQVLHYRAGRKTVVFMPYATSLSGLSEWFCQLWAESLGKRRGEESIGPTPVAALGVRDQHSQLQLFMEGPKDKNLLFVELAGFSSSITVPILKSVPAVMQHLCGKSLEGIVAAELNGTRQALFEQGCPSATLRLRTLSAESLGAMLMLLEVTTALAAGLLDVDPYNQPGVELGKRYAHGLLGRSKEAHYAASLKATKAERLERVLTI
jgi:glucose-6-phosphate isomerase